MSESKGLKSLLKQANKRDGNATGLAVEGEHYVKRRKGETQEEFEKRKKAFEKKMKAQKKQMIKRAREMFN